MSVSNAGLNKNRYDYSVPVKAQGNYLILGKNLKRNTNGQVNPQNQNTMPLTSMNPQGGIGQTPPMVSMTPNLSNQLQPPSA